MDMRRSCANTLMRYVAGDTSKVFTARWYFCKPTALPFPTWHSFGSRIWDDKRRRVTTLGDDATTTSQYSKGVNPNESDGTTFAGPLEYFQNGAPAPGTIPRTETGTPVSCLVPLHLARGGGKLKGGESEVTRPTFITGGGGKLKGGESVLSP